VRLRPQHGRLIQKEKAMRRSAIFFVALIVAAQIGSGAEPVAKVDPTKLFKKKIIYSEIISVTYDIQFCIANNSTCTTLIANPLPDNALGSKRQAVTVPLRPQGETKFFLPVPPPLNSASHPPLKVYIVQIFPITDTLGVGVTDDGSSIAVRATYTQPAQAKITALYGRQIEDTVLVSIP
jgi:hypothetical protein